MTKKRAIVCGVDFFYYVDGYAYALEKLGYEIKVIKFKRNEDTLKDKITKIFKGNEYKNDFCEKQVSSLLNLIDEFKPEEIYSISSNYYYEFVNKKTLKELKQKKIKTNYILIDSIKRYSEYPHNVEYYDNVFVFEKNDISFIQDKYHIKARYMPIGVAENIYCQNISQEHKEYDISFVGFSNKDRLPILEKIAKFCHDKGLKFIVVGIYWTHDHWWYYFTKQMKLRFKYPHLYNIVTNNVMINEEVANLYNNSKISLNIHISMHSGINPRTFEIMGNSNFQLCDNRLDMNSFGLKDGENIALFQSADDCINKIDYYLQHESERKAIAKKGCKFVRENYTMSKILKKIIKEQ